MFSITSAGRPPAITNLVPTATSWTASILGAPSEQYTQVFRHQDVLLQDQLAPRDQPGVAVAPQRIDPAADEGIGLVLHSVLVNQEAAANDDILRILGGRG